MASVFYEYQSALLAERFHTLEIFDTGPHGQVFRAYDRKMDAIIAVKKLQLASIVQEDQLKREILEIKKVRHRNIIPIYYALIRPGVALLISPIRERTLCDLIPMPYDMQDKTTCFYSLAIQMLSALTYLQEEGICHRNIKPNNILMQATECGYGFYLSDFALTYPQTGRVDYLYSAPETHTDVYPVTCKQDVWSLFVTLAVTCGRVSEAEISRKSPLEIVQTIMDMGTSMPELDDMARFNPTQRASASVMFHRLRPKEQFNYYGGVDYPEVSTAFFGLYGSGRLETEPMVFIGPHADLSGLDGPLGLSPTSVVQRPPATVQMAKPLPANSFDLGLHDQPTFYSRESSFSPLSEYLQSPPEELQQDEQFQPEPRIKREEQMESLQGIPEYDEQMERLVEDESRQSSELDLRPFRSMVNSCPTTRSYDGPADNQGPLPPLRSIIPRMPSANEPQFSPRYTAFQQLADQIRLSPDLLRELTTLEPGPVHDGYPTVIFNGVGFIVQPQGLSYLRPYPVPCDYPAEPSQPI
ncbi:kinase-like domain-containing protein [Trichoderma austrokoningii]